MFCLPAPQLLDFPIVSVVFSCLSCSSAPTLLRGGGPGPCSPPLPILDLWRYSYPQLCLFSISLNRHLQGTTSGVLLILDLISTHLFSCNIIAKSRMRSVRKDQTPKYGWSLLCMFPHFMLL